MLDASVSEKGKFGSRSSHIEPNCFVICWWTQTTLEYIFLAYDIQFLQCGHMGVHEDKGRAQLNH